MDASDFGWQKFDSVEEKHDWIGLSVRKVDLISYKLLKLDPELLDGVGCHGSNGGSSAAEGNKATERGDRPVTHRLERGGDATQVMHKTKHTITKSGFTCTSNQT